MVASRGEGWGEATVRATAEIPAGQASVIVARDVVDDSIFNGAWTVPITASAAEFVDGGDAGRERRRR